MAEEAKWYVAHTYSGYENKVKANIEKSVENRGMQDLILDVKVPTEEVVEENGDKKKVVQHKIFPGYVIIKMIMTDEKLVHCQKYTWCYRIRGTGFKACSAFGRRS